MTAAPGTQDRRFIAACDVIGRRGVKVPVSGVLEFAGGLIQARRDDFDPAGFQVRIAVDPA